MTATQTHPNEIKYFNVKADQVDITSMVLQLDIYQDLFMPTWSCQIAFSDTQNLLMNVPIKPGTVITIQAETVYPEAEFKTFKFIVYKISDRILIKQEHQGYMLSCVTREFYDNQKNRISRSLKNMNPHTMIDTICKEHGVGNLVENDTDGKQYSVIVPNMSPFAAINWISRFTKLGNGGADFLFYQSDLGEFKFKSLDKMFADRSKVTFKQINPNISDDGNIPDDAFINIEFYEFASQHDSMNNFAAGYYGNIVLTHDIMNKSFDSTIFNYGDDIAKDAENKPFEGELFDNAGESHIVYHPVSPGGMAKDLQLPGDTVGEWMGSRKTNMMKLEENRLIMGVPGSVAHYKLLGKQVDVELPSHQDADEDYYLDKYMKGSYVVAAIRHTISSEFYKCTLELGKKRLEEAYD